MPNTNAANITTSENPNISSRRSLIGAMVVRIHPPFPGCTLKPERFMVFLFEHIPGQKCLILFDAAALKPAYSKKGLDSATLLL